MLKWFNCYLSGRHDFGVWCGEGSIYLRCLNCGKRSNGWAVRDQDLQLQPAAARSPQVIQGNQPRSSGVARFWAR